MHSICYIFGFLKAKLIIEVKMIDRIIPKKQKFNIKYIV